MSIFLNGKCCETPLEHVVITVHFAESASILDSTGDEEDEIPETPDVSNLINDEEEEEEETGKSMPKLPTFN